MAGRTESLRPWTRGTTARGAFGVVVSVISLAGVVWWASHQPEPRLPSDAAGLAFVALALLAYATITFTRAPRWSVILRSAGIGGSYPQALELVIIGYMGTRCCRCAVASCCA